ncbi:MAG: hypothetical protein JWN86_2753 [Planctomycetota bacterium]|nr:hypothetical protein [Planctomycetota bacterium]
MHGIILWAALGVMAPPESLTTVSVEIHESLPKNWDWTTAGTVNGGSFPASAFGFVGVPAKVNGRGIEIDRPGAFALHATATIKVPAGPYRFLLRARNSARILVDGTLLAETKTLVRNSAGHEPVPPIQVPEDLHWHALAAGDQERIVPWISDGNAHRVEMWAIVGGNGLRPETGELCAAIVRPGDVPRLIGSDIPLSDESWSRYADEEAARIVGLESADRRRAAGADDPFWTKRHEIARKESERAQAVVGEGNLIDRHFAAAKLVSVDDAAFFRRLSLDTIGVIPDPKEVAAYLIDTRPDKKARAVEARLNDPRWADNWMGYWQDVLAENPGLLKPTLNNTGPFRRFLYTAFCDNLPMDRLVSELIRMDGSALGGGPAGFGMATQNDAPMAAKAHILAKAFLAADLKCARCHDAPSHPFGQEDLFAIAGLLDGKPQVIPATSTVVRQPGGRMPTVSVALAAGDQVPAGWALTDIVAESLPPGVLPPNASSRDHLAALITSPTNTRFAPVIVNRLWHRLLGVGLVEPLDDWDGELKERHPELLAALARELMAHGYDLKHVARLIVNSELYASQVGPLAPAPSGSAAASVSISRRRMSAEQVLDSMFAAVGKPFRAEVLCLDIDGRRPPSEFLNLGRPRRAWQLATASNERDRPSLTLPVVQSLTDLLQVFGWRAARPDPITLREDAMTPLQPASLANSVVVDGRIARLSDDSEITELCLKKQDPEALIRAVYLRVFSRLPTDAETNRLVAYLGETYDGRIVPGVAKRPPMRPSSRSVSWSNHLHPDATTIQQDEERVVRDGDPPTARLTPQFRERMEDVVWALINSPEFIFLP